MILLFPLNFEGNHTSHWTSWFSFGYQVVALAFLFTSPPPVSCTRYRWKAETHVRKASRGFIRPRTAHAQNAFKGFQYSLRHHLWWLFTPPAQLHEVTRRFRFAITHAVSLTAVNHEWKHLQLITGLPLSVSWNFVVAECK